jgi:hypothetical protein
VKNYLDKLLGNQQLLYGLGTAFIVVIMVYSGYTVLKANVASIAAYVCFFPAALAAVVIALVSGLGREDRIAELPYGVQFAAKVYNTLASAFVGSALMIIFGVVILPLVMLSNWIDELRS